MNKRIEAAYEQRPRRWVFELVVAVVVVALLIWSGSAVETAGTTQSGAKIAWNILAGIFHPDTWKPSASPFWVPLWAPSSPSPWPSSRPPT